MKKIIATTLIAIVLLGLFSACTSTSNSGHTHSGETESPTNDTSDTNSNTSSPTTEPTPHPDEDLSSKVQYDEETPLFVAEDRADIEGDRDEYYFYNYKGELLDSSVLTVRRFFAKNGLASAYDPATEMVGYVDQSGVFVIYPQWDGAAAFSDDGIALVYVYKINKKGSTAKAYGYINEKGEQITDCIYDDATSFYSQGVAIIGLYTEVDSSYTNSNGENITTTDLSIRYGVIDKSGKIIIEPKYTTIYNVESNYIICEGENAQAVYDLSGNAIVTEEECNEKHYSFYQELGTLHRYTIETITDEEAEQNNGISYRDTDHKIYDGKEFVDEPRKTDKVLITCKRVATTATGYAYGHAQWSDQSKSYEDRIPYAYDSIIEAGNYYIGIKYKDSAGNDRTFDIYNSEFEKTAENINYNYYHIPYQSLYGANIALPEGYFRVTRYDDKTGRVLMGIINERGEIIVPILFYRPIGLFTYEGVGGKFMSGLL